MNAVKIIGVVLIVAGVLGLAYGSEDRSARASGEG
ncbi:MAG: hypothetical protein K0Q83_3179 [Deltaproteobacteria bacterium]|nr:hypothetical protein [Deltaproteobacteria bacterium]